MGWYRTPTGHVVQGDGSLERLYVARGYEELAEPVALGLVIEHRARAELSAAERAEARRVLREEGVTPLSRVKADPKPKPAAKKTTPKPKRT